MSDNSTVPPPNACSAAIVQDAVQRARKIASQIGGDTAPPMNSNDCNIAGQKRPLDDGDQPEAKKVAPTNDSFQPVMPQIHQSRSVLTEESKVPDGMVGFIIGRGGEQISHIQQESGCKIQIAPDSGGMPDQSCTLTGNPDSVMAAKQLLDQIVEKGRPAPGYHGDGPENSVPEIMIPAGLEGEETIEHIQMPIPQLAVETVIGKNGEMIKKIQSEAGVKIQIKPDDGSTPDRIAQISGPPDRCRHAKELITDLFFLTILRLM